MDQNQATHKLKIFFSCVGLLSNTSHVQVQSSITENVWVENGKTEVVQNDANPDYKTCIEIFYNFEVEVKVWFEVFNEKLVSIGYSETTVGDIVGAKNGYLELQLQNEENENVDAGSIIVRYDIQKESNQYILMKWGAKLDQDLESQKEDKYDPYLKISRLKNQQEEKYKTVDQTEYYEDELNPEWEELDIKMETLCGCDYKMKIKAEVLDKEEVVEEEENFEMEDYGQKKPKQKKKEYIGECIFTIEEIKGGKMQFDLLNKEKQGLKVGTLFLRKYEIVDWPDFIKYVRGGFQLNLVLAIDYTSSNKTDDGEFNLHAISETGEYNQYQQAINDVSSILLSYDHDKLVPCYGFGAMPLFNLNNPDINQIIENGEHLDNVSHCFALTGQEHNPEVKDLSGIMDLYKKSINDVIFSGPTYFSKLINQSLIKAKQLKQEKSDAYLLLLILTDGAISEEDQSITKDLIVEATDYPLSIIIIGVGPNDFRDMKVLDGDKGGLKNSSGKKAQRDLVQFVKYEKYKDNPKELAKHVLQEIPEQIRRYLMIQKIMPQKAPDTLQTIKSCKSNIIIKKEQSSKSSSQQQTTVITTIQTTTTTTTSQQKEIAQQSSESCEEHIKKINLLTKQLDQCCREKKKLSDDYDQLRDCNNTLQECISDLRSQLAVYQSKSDKSNNKTLQKIVNQVQIFTFKNQRDELKKQLEQSKLQIKIEAQQFNNKIEFLIQQQKKFKDDMAEQQTNYNILKQDYDNELKNSQAKGFLLQQCQDEKKRLESSIADLKLEIKRMKTYAEEQEKQIQKVNSQKYELQVLVNNNSTQIQRLEETHMLDKLNWKKESETTLITLRTTFESEMKITKDSLTQIQTKLTACEQECNNEKQKRDKQIAQQRQQIEDLKVKVNQEQKKSKELQAKLDMEAQLKAQLETKIADLEAQLRAANERIQVLLSQEQSLQQEIRVEKDMNVSLREAKESVEKSASKLEVRLQIEQKEHDDLLQKLGKVSDELTKLGITVKDQERKIKQDGTTRQFSMTVLQSELTQCRKERDQLNVRIKELTEELNKTRQESNTSQNTITQTFTEKITVIEIEHTRIITERETIINTLKEEKIILIQQHEQALAKEQQINEELRNMLKTTKEKLETITIQLQTEQTERSKERTSNEEQIKQLQQKLTEVTAARDSLDVQVKELTIVVEQREATIKKINDEKTRLLIERDNNYNDLKKRFETTESNYLNQVKLYNQQIEIVNQKVQEIETLSGTIKQLQSQILQLNQEIEVLKKDKQQLILTKITIKQLQEKVIILEKKEKELISKLQDEQKKQEELQMTIQDKENDQKGKLDLISKLQKTKQETSAKSSARAISGALLQSQLTQCQKDKADLISQLEQQRQLAESQFLEKTMVINNLEKERMQFQTEIQTLQTTIITITRELEVTNVTIKEIQKEKAHIQELRQTSENTLQERNAQILKLQQHESELTDSVERLNQANQALQREIQLLKKQLSELDQARESDRVRAADDAASSRKIIEERNQRIVTIERIVETHITSIEELRVEVHTRDQEIERLRIVEKNLTLEKNALSQSLSESQESELKSQKQIEKLKQEKASIDRSLKESDKTRAQAINKLKLIEQAMTVLQGLTIKQETLIKTIEEYRLNYKEYKAELERYKKEIVQLKTVLEQQRALTEAEKKNFTQQKAFNDLLQQQINTLQGENQTLKQDKQQLEINLENAKQKITSLEGTEKSLRQLIEDLENKIKELEKKTQDQRSSNIEGKVTNLTAGLQLTQCKKQKEALEKTLTEQKTLWEQQSKTYQVTINTLEVKVQQFTLEISTFKQVIVDLQNEREQLIKAGNESKSQLSEKTTIIIQLQETVSDHSSQIESLKKQLEQALKRAQSEQDRLTQEIQELKQTLELEKERAQKQRESQEKIVKQLEKDAQIRENAYKENIIRVSQHNEEIRQETIKIQNTFNTFIVNEFTIVREKLEKQYVSELANYKKTVEQHEQLLQIEISKKNDLLKQLQELQVKYLQVQDQRRRESDNMNAQFQNQNRENYNLRVTVKSKQEKIEDYEREVAKLEKQIQELELLKQKQNEQFQSLLETLQRSRYDSEQLQQQKNKFNIKDKISIIRVMMTKEKIRKLEDTISKKSREVEERNKKIITWESDFETLRVEHEKTLDSLKLLQQKYKDLQATLNSTENNLSEKVKLLEKSRADNQTSSDKIKDLKKQLQEKNDEIDQSNTNIKQLKVNEEQLNLTIISLQETITKLQKRVEEEENNTKKQKREGDEAVEKVRAELTVIIQKLEKVENVDIPNLKKEHSERLRQSNEQYQQVQVELAHRIQELASAEERAKGQAGEINQLRTTIESLHTSIESFEKTITLHVHTISELKITIETRTQENQQQIKIYRDLEQASQQLRTELDVTRQRVNDLLGENEVLRLSKTHVEEELKQQEKQLSDMVNQSKAVSVVNRLQGVFEKSQQQQTVIKLQQLSEKYEKLEKSYNEQQLKFSDELARLQEQLRIQGDKIQTLDKENQELKQQKTTLEETVKKLNKQMSAYRQTIEEKQSQISKITRDNTQLTQRFEELQRQYDILKKEKQDLNEQYTLILERELESIKQHNQVIHQQMLEQQQTKMLEIILKSVQESNAVQIAKYEEQIVLFQTIKEQRATLEVELHSIQQNFSQLQAEHASKLELLAQVQQELSAAYLKIKTLTAEWEEQCTLAKQESSKVENQIQTIKKLNDQLLQIQTEKFTTDSRMSEVNQELEKFRKLSITLELQVKAQLEEIERSAKLTVEWQDRFNSQERRLDEKTIQIKGLNTQNEDISKQLIQLKKTLEELRIRNDELTRENENLQQELIQYTKSLSEQRREQAKIEEQAKTEKIHLTQKESELIECQKQYQILTQQYQTMQIDCSRLKSSNFSLFYDNLRYLYLQQKRNVEQALQDQQILLQVENFKYQEQGTIIELMAEQNKISQQEKASLLQSRHSLSVSSQDLQQRFISLQQDVQKYQALQKQDAGILGVDQKSVIALNEFEQEQKSQLLGMLSQVQQLNQVTQIAGAASSQVIAQRLLQSSTTVAQSSTVAVEGQAQMSMAQSIISSNKEGLDKLLKELRSRLDASEEQFKVLSQLMASGGEQVAQQQ